MSDFLLSDLIHALELFGIERKPDSSFSAITPPPAWITSVVREAADAPVTLEGAFPFMESFLREAEAFWHAGTERSIISGPFAVVGTPGELLLRATALNLGPRCVLVLERLRGDADTRPLLQKARDNKLQYKRLAKQLQEVQAPAAALARLAKELLATDLTSAQRELAAAIAAAGARVEQAAAGAAP